MRYAATAIVGAWCLVGAFGAVCLVAEGAYRVARRLGYDPDLEPIDRKRGAYGGTVVELEAYRRQGEGA